MLVEFAWCSGFREYAYLLTKITKKKKEKEKEKEKININQIK